jgi:Co/Zn/Cd efflux system component
MVLIAGVGLVVNVISVWLLHDSYHTNLNLRGVFLHVLSDLLGSIGAIVAGRSHCVDGLVLGRPFEPACSSGYSS